MKATILCDGFIVRATGAALGDVLFFLFFLFLTG